MTEAEARRLLRDWPGIGGLEAWIAERRWKAIPGGWEVLPDLQGWRFKLEVVSGGIRVSAAAPGPGEPAVWIVRG
jgi:hypothetical protein